MRTSRARSDGNRTNEMVKSLRTYAVTSQRSTHRDYYNRLESETHSHFSRAVNCARLESLLLAVRASGSLVIGDIGDLSIARPFLSPSQARESSHKQVWGITPFRRGNA